MTDKEKAITPAPAALTEEMAAAVVAAYNQTAEQVASLDVEGIKAAAAEVLHNAEATTEMLRGTITEELKHSTTMLQFAKGYDSIILSNAAELANSITAFINSDAYKAIKESFAAIAEWISNYRQEIKLLADLPENVQDLAPFIQLELEDARITDPAFAGCSLQDVLTEGFDADGNPLQGKYRALIDAAAASMAKLASTDETFAEIEQSAADLSAAPGAAKEIEKAQQALKGIETVTGYIRQGVATNTLTKMMATKKNTTVDPITGKATIKRGQAKLTFAKDMPPRVSTYQLFDAMTEVLTQTGAKAPLVQLPLTAYMERRKISDRKAAREQVQQDLDTLYNASISYREHRRNGKDQDFLDMRICDLKGIKNGVIYFSFGSALYMQLRNYPIMPAQPILYQINGKRNPNSYFLMRKIMEHKNMNAGKKNEDLIAVTTLLSVCDTIPSYEDVMQGNRHITERIIEPFERDLNALADTLSWEYCHSNGTPLTDEELEQFNYDVFHACLIQVYWGSYPDQTARLAVKRERQAKKKAQRQPPQPKKA